MATRFMGIFIDCYLGKCQWQLIEDCYFNFYLIEKEELILPFTSGFKVLVARKAFLGHS
jgi:hypothetical protein